MTTFVCPVCGVRWKVLPEAGGDVERPCPTCAPRCSGRYWRQAGCDYGWAHGVPGILCAELWTPFGQDAGAWVDRLLGQQLGPGNA